MSEPSAITETLQAAVLPMLRSLPKDQRSEAFEQLLHLGYELCRGAYGNDWARGWLDAARSDLAQNPPFVRLVEPN